MTRNPIQDIVPNGNRSIRNIPLSSKRTHVEEPQEEIRKEILKSVREEFEYVAEERSGSGSSKKYFVFGGVIAVIVVAILVVSSVFHAATIIVTPRIASVSIKDDVTAVKSSAAAGLSFQSKVIRQTGSVQLKALGEKKVNTQASGTIVIYNNYGTASQRLVKNTRFETPEGLIYRISDSVTVPGKKGTTPGSIEATVLADEAGDKYNVGLKDFTIPGFKGDPRYAAFTAKSKPSAPLQGGFSGTVKTVAEADMAKAQSDIKTKATVELLKQAQAQVPEGSVFFTGADTILCSPLPQESVSSGEVLIKMECVLSAAFFDKQALSSYLAKTRVNGYKNEPILMRNIENLSFVPKAGFDPAAESISFSLSGDATFEWLYDEVAFKQKLAGAKVSDVPSITQGFPTIEKVEVSIRPFWRKTFPAEVKSIMVKKAF